MPALAPTHELESDRLTRRCGRTHGSLRVPLSCSIEDGAGAGDRPPAPSSTMWLRRAGSAGRGRPAGLRLPGGAGGLDLVRGKLDVTGLGHRSLGADTRVR